MTESEWTAKWENELGEVSYQPRRPNGEVLWENDILGSLWSKTQPHGFFPDLYLRQEVAEKKARREHENHARRTWRRVT